MNTVNGGMYVFSLLFLSACIGANGSIWRCSGEERKIDGWNGLDWTGLAWTEMD